MKALICNSWGDIENLEYTDLAKPQPKLGQVLIKVKASAVNYADIVMIKGEYQTKPTFPFSPGLECSGIIESVGENVSEFSKGDHVLAKLTHGGFAEYALANVDSVFSFPKSMSWEEAGSFFVGYISSFVAIKYQAQLNKSQSMLVLGASGGTGLTAVEIGKSFGAKIIAAASTEKKLEICSKYGADHLINYSKQNLKEKINEISNNKGVDVIFDPVGGDLFNSALSSLGWGGTYIIFGFVAGIPKIPANRLLVKHRSAVGSSLRYFEIYEPEKIKSGVQELFKLYEKNMIKPFVSKKYPLVDSIDALTDLKNRNATGRIVIKIN